MLVRYEIGKKPAASALVELYRASTFGQYRPLESTEAVEQMINHANLVVTAWDGALLVGMARSLTDFGYIAYLADLVVRASHQRQGIGIELTKQTQQQLGNGAKIVLWAAPEAEDYYFKIGMEKISSAWLLRPEQKLGTSS